MAQVPYTWQPPDGGRRRRDGRRPGRSGLLRLRSPLVLEVRVGARPPRLDLGRLRRQDALGQERRLRERRAARRARAAGHRRDEPLRRSRGPLPHRRDVVALPSAAYTGTGRNDFGYKYGDNVQVNLVYDRKLTDWLDGVLEVNFLDAKQDQVDALGVPDPNTGGQTPLPHAARRRAHRQGPRRPRRGPVSGVGEPERHPGHQARLHRRPDVRVLATGDSRRGQVFIFRISRSVRGSRVRPWICTSRAERKQESRPDPGYSSVPASDGARRLGWNA